MIFYHAVFSVISFILAFFVFFRKKGDLLHRIFGGLFNLSMLISCISSFYIGKTFSPIHLLSVCVIYWITMSFYCIRFKSNNWLNNHIQYQYAAYISILIAGIGVIGRHYIDYGNSNLGFMLSAILALPLIIYSKEIVSFFLKKKDFS